MHLSWNLPRQLKSLASEIVYLSYKLFTLFILVWLEVAPRNIIIKKKNEIIITKINSK